MSFPVGEAAIATLDFTLGGTAEQAAAADTTRRSLLIQAIDADIWVSLVGNAGNGVGFLLQAGQSRVMYARDWPQIRNAVSVWCATTNARYVVQTDMQI